MFFTQILVNSLVLGTQILLLAVSMYLIHSVSKVYHLALGASGTASAYSLYFCLSMGWSWGAAISSGILIAIIVSVISYKLLESSIRKKEIMLGLLISLSLSVAIESILSIIFGTGAKSLIKDVLPIISWDRIYITIPGIITLAVGIILALVFVLLLKKTPWGRNLLSVSENDRLAASLAINPSAIRLSVFIIAGLLAAFISTLTVMNTALTPQGGFSLVILAFIVLLIGGITDIRGTIIASYLVVLLPEFIVSLSDSSWGIGPNWKMVLVFILASLVLIMRPGGLFINKVRID